MRLGGIAQYLAEIVNKDELVETVTWAKSKKIDMFMIGQGSNIIWRDEGFNGLVMVNKIQGFEMTDQTQEEVYITVGAGESWDSVVERVCSLGLSGIETLSLIPGTAGATPIQNVGAYGSEIANTLVSVEAYDREKDEFTILSAADCELGYRTSNFKTKYKYRYFIVGITFKLSRKMIEAPFYDSVQEYINVHKIGNLTPQILRNIVVEIRRSKLPDPDLVANCGSFFTNPMIDTPKLHALQRSYPTIPYWQVDESRVKLSAAWLMDQCGYKAVNDPTTGISTWPTQTLVLVNTAAKKTADLLKFKQKLIRDVDLKFGVKLFQEPELLP